MSQRQDFLVPYASGNWTGDHCHHTDRSNSFSAQHFREGIYGESNADVLSSYISALNKVSAYATNFILDCLP